MLSDDLVKRYSQFDIVAADGCKLPYPDKSFDVGFSNSAIEHVGTYERQKAFAAELRRVGLTLLVQKPEHFRSYSFREGNLDWIVALFILWPS